MMEVLLLIALVFMKITPLSIFPFYGVFHPDSRIIKWLNRLFVIAEAVLIYYAAKHYIEVHNLDKSLISLTILLAWPVMKVVASYTRFIWELILVAVFGTTDANEIMNCHWRKESRRIRKQNKRDMIAAEEKRIAEEKAQAEKDKEAEDHYLKYMKENNLDPNDPFDEDKVIVF